MTTGKKRRRRSSAAVDLEGSLERLLDVGKPVPAELGQEAALKNVLHHARELTGARYAALGVLDEDRMGLERFLTLGVDDATRRRIGGSPRGRGVLGVLVDDPRPVLIRDIRTHPASYGFPAGHPEMRSFLGVPIVINERAWGNLYLAEKRDGESFTEQDVETAIALAQWAASAVGGARMDDLPRDGRYEQLDPGDCSLGAGRDTTNVIGSAADLGRALKFIVNRARDIIGAQGLLMMLREGDELFVAACAGLAQVARGRRVAIAGSMSGQVLEHGQPVLVTDMEAELQIDPAAMGLRAAVALLVPMVHRRTGVGVFAAFDQHADGFTDEDLRLLRAFAKSTADAVATGLTGRDLR